MGEIADYVRQLQALWAAQRLLVKTLRLAIIVKQVNEID